MRVELVLTVDRAGRILPGAMTTMTRRDLLAGLGATAMAGVAQPTAAQGTPIPIIDTHIHLFDPTRPQGAPYSGPRRPGVAPVPAYPDRYRKLATPLGSVGAIKVEASPWVEDNLWVLEVAQRDTIIVGVVGNLEPDKPEFKEYFDRYRKHPLFRGIRYGNLWGRDIAKQAENPAFIDGLELVADADLVLDTANPRIALLESILKISDKVPTLRIVLDHLPNFAPTSAERPAYDAALREFAKRPQVFVKLSAIIRRVDGKVSTDLNSYRDTLDLLVGTFGEDRILFGSDWPNSDGVAPIDQVFRVAKEYFDTKPRPVAEKYFWRNSIAAYKWIKREPAQPSL
jgi:predicted TIM-barrel fold metal-dependent hydrolase